MRRLASANCPHPACPIAVRLVTNPHTGTTTLYHGEDALVEVGGLGDVNQLDESGQIAVMAAIADVLAGAIAEFHLGL